MDLCKKTYIQTKDLHKIVDNHSLVKNINLDSKESEYYINLIKYVLFLLESKMKSNEFYEGLKRNPKINFVPFNDITKKIMNDYTNPVLFASQIYLWYLSLMAGGKILRKKLPKESHYLLDFTETQKLELKQIMYKLIAEYFDKFYNNN
jgi:hypothetical protein